MFALPLQVIDSFLLQYNMGQVFVFLFALGLLATLPLKNKTVIGLHTVVFGLLFLLTPTGLMEPGALNFKLLGVALLFVGPMVLVINR